MTVPLTFGGGSGGYVAASPVTAVIAGVQNTAYLITVYGKDTAIPISIVCENPTIDLVKLGETVSTKAVVAGADVGRMRVAMYLWTPQATTSITFSFTGSADVMGCHWKTFTPTSNEAVRWEAAVAIGEDLTGDASWSAVLSPSVDLRPDDSIFVASIIPTDVTTPAQFTADTLSAPGIVFSAMSDQGEPDTTLGNDLGGSFFQQSVVSGSGTVVATVTATVAATFTNVYGPTIMGRLRAIAIDARGTDTIQFEYSQAAYSAPIYQALPKAGAGFLVNDAIATIPPGSEGSIQATYNQLPEVLQDASPNDRDGTYYAADATPLAAAGYDAAVLARSPLAYYDRAFELVAGKYGNVPDAAWMDFTTFSVVAVIKPTGVAGTQTIMCRYNGSGATTNAWIFRLNGNKLGFYVGVGGTWYTVASPTSLASAGTYDVGASFDGTNLKLYLNGALNATFTVPTPPVVMNLTAEAIVIGANSALAENFVGTVDSPAIFPLLADADFAALAAAS